jgi:hypothetical protein
MKQFDGGFGSWILALFAIGLLVALFAGKIGPHYPGVPYNPKAELTQNVFAIGSSPAQMCQGHHGVQQVSPLGSFTGNGGLGPGSTVFCNDGTNATVSLTP